ncbi:MAG: hypothetical protein ACLFN8_04240 [Candidatus Woesearchaeota archaeon]
MSTMMPYAKKWGVLAGILFTFSAMLMFDLITGTLGVWSLLTISAYLIVALFAGIYFKNRGKVKHYVIFAIIGTLFYDAVTSISVGVFVFNQSLMQTLILQIPFTLIHLLSNIVLAALVSPLLYKWILRNPKWETSKVILYFKNVFRG